MRQLRRFKTQLRLVLVFYIFSFLSCRTPSKDNNENPGKGVVPADQMTVNSGFPPAGSSLIKASECNKTKTLGYFCRNANGTAGICATASSDDDISCLPPVTKCSPSTAYKPCIDQLVGLGYCGDGGVGCAGAANHCAGPDISGDSGGFDCLLPNQIGICRNKICTPRVSP